MTLAATKELIVYPESDGQPLADNTLQFRYITTIHGGIAGLFKDDPNVFVAADLFWYPVEGEPWTKLAPDVMVAFGRPQGERRSYRQWEEGNIAPQVVFEVASPSNTPAELEGSKLHFYSRYGVDEYYLYDPDRGTLKGWWRGKTELEAIAQMSGWVSPQLGIRFELVEQALELYRPDGERFGSYVEVLEQKQQAQQQAEQEHQRAEQEHQRAEQEHQRAEQEHQRAEEAEQARRAIAQSQQQAIPRLRKLGLNQAQIAEVLGIPLDQMPS